LLHFPSHARFASTTPSTPLPTTPPAPSSPNPPPAELDLDFLDPARLSAVPEEIGFLRNLGFDYGWGPTSVMQWALEHIHVYSGGPWWLSIAAMCVAVRLSVWRLSVKAMEQQAKGQELRKDPEYNRLLEIQKSVLKGGNIDQATMISVRQEMAQRHRAAGYQMWRTLLPLIQLPFAFGAFRLLRGMADLPVPSLVQGGLFWFQDLSVPDPFFLLPIGAAGLMFMAMQAS
jgi:YidC/Oxa1 family membrane protein insertase